jgi:hypothetical protein
VTDDAHFERLRVHRHRSSQGKRDLLSLHEHAADALNVLGDLVYRGELDPDAGMNADSMIRDALRALWRGGARP